MIEKKQIIAEEYLEQIKKIDIIIHNKKTERQRWVDVAEGLGEFSTSERVQSSGNPQKIADAIARYVDIDIEIKRLADKKNNIIKTIEQLPTNEYDVLHKIYVQYLRIIEVAAACDRSYDWVKKTKHRALNHLQKILDAQ